MHPNHRGARDGSRRDGRQRARHSLRPRRAARKLPDERLARGADHHGSELRELARPREDLKIVFERLAKAKTGVFPISAMQEYTQNYLRAGGTGAFSHYYTADGDHALLRSALRRNIIFAQHNLVSDAGFNEFHVILCRNVMIYFNRTLQARVHQLFFDSLVSGGFLALGSKETIAFTALENSYVSEDADQKIYRKLK